MIACSITQASATSEAFESLGDIKIKVKNSDLNINVYAYMDDTKSFESILMSANKPFELSDSYDLHLLDMKFSCNSESFYSALPYTNFYILISMAYEQPSTSAIYKCQTSTMIAYTVHLPYNNLKNLWAISKTLIEEDSPKPQAQL